MQRNSKLTFVLDKAKESFEGRPPFVNARLPLPSINGQNANTDSFVPVPALWTKDGFKPQWKNLAVVVSDLENSEKLNWWDNILVNLGVPLGVFVLDNAFFLKSLAPTGGVQTEQIAAENLGAQLSERNPLLFTPRSLGALRRGQLSFADTEDSVTPESFSFHVRYHAKLSQSLENAITAAFVAELDVQRRALNTMSTPDTSSVYDSVLIVTIAFLAARILEDKGFFGSNQMPTDNVEALLKRTILKTNGFFRKAFRELPRVSDQALQHLSVELGSRSIFTLIDHHDVAELYERAIRAPLSTPEVANLRASLLDLQQYYTPIALAEKMLDLLPLERLRPEERRIFDPAAGSGTLLLAATQRLAAMTDLPPDRDFYLANHVSGNDLDRNANLLTRVRYILSQETEGIMLPAPAHFSDDDFEQYTKDNLPTRPRVIVANPPFEEQQNVQRAARFLELVTDWLTEGDQFAVILPHAFLTGSTHGMNKARRRLSERSHLFEIWQLPEGVVGVTARQAVCVVIGCIGQAHQPTVVRSTISGAMAQTAREKGFLAETWIAEIAEKSDCWEPILARPISLPQSTVLLEDLYYTFTGVNPDKHFPPIPEPIPGVDTKPYWKLSWKEKGRIWADPDRRLPRERYIRYGTKYLEGARVKNSFLFDMPKIMVARTVNRNSNDPLAACIDTIGLCPNVNIFCITTRESKEVDIPSNTKKPNRWSLLTDEEKLFWLLGILTSELGCEISLLGRSARHLTTTLLRKFPLPDRVDPNIVSVVRQMLERDKNRYPLSTPDPLRSELNHLVEAAYANPRRIKSARTGITPEYETSLTEALVNTVNVTGQVRDVSVVRSEVLLWLEGIKDEIKESWIPLPPEMPGWALNGDIFTASLSNDIQTFSDLAARPRALRDFRHTPRPYLTIEELQEQFAMTQ